MKEIHYFQRYSQKENWLTNSTLLLLNRLYLSSPIKFNKYFEMLFFNSQIEASFGITFGQQIKSENSIPDGMIYQQSTQIMIESKFHAKLDEDQLIRHLDSFDRDSSQKILIGLTNVIQSDEIEKRIYNKIKKSKKYTGIKYKTLSYEDIYNSMKSILNENDYELHEILEDYYSLCFEEGLIDNSNSKMLAVTAGTSLSENFKYNIYYDPADRKNNQSFKYLGLYDSKAIVGIGEIKKIVKCNLKNNKLVVLDDNELTRDEKNRIVQMINETDYYDITSGSKFYLVDKFHETNFKKTSYGPMRGKNYFDLTIFLDSKQIENSEIIAELLKNEEWE